MTTTYLIIKKTVGSEGKPFVDNVMDTKEKVILYLRGDRVHFHRLEEQGMINIISETFSQDKIYTVNWYDYVTEQKCSYTVRIKEVELGD